MHEMCSAYPQHIFSAVSVEVPLQSPDPFSPVLVVLYASHWWFSGRILACHAGGRVQFPANAMCLLISSC